MAQVATVHDPALHAAVVCGSEQTLPHALQFPALVLRFTSQPFAALPSQSAKPALHTRPQVPVVHVAVPLFGVGQAWSQVPQLLTSACTLVQISDVAQNVVPVGHELTQVPLEQCVPAAQPMPQPPQLVLVPRVVSQPLAAAPSQFAKPVLHAPTAHAPAVHASVPLGMLHAVVHAPHDATVVARFTSQPSAALSLQSP